MPAADPTAPVPARVLVYGVTGSGKSTLATRLAAMTGLPLVLADELTWLPGWQAVREDRQREIFAEVAGGERWVLDTAYGAWLDVVLPRAELVVGLDYPRWFSLQRLVRRTLARATDKRPICNGNTESWRNLVRRDGIIGWHFNSFLRKQRRMRTWQAAESGPPVLLFTDQRDLDRWLDGHASAPGR